MRLFHEQPRHCHQRSLYKLYCAYACVRVRVQGRHAYMHACVHAYACMRMHSRSRDLEPAYIHTHHTHTHTRHSRQYDRIHPQIHTTFPHTHAKCTHTNCTHTYIHGRACMHAYIHIHETYIRTYVYTYAHASAFPHTRKGQENIPSHIQVHIRHTFHRHCETPRRVRARQKRLILIGKSS